MNGYKLLTQEQREEMNRLNEKATHTGLNPLESVTLVEYERLCERLEQEKDKT